MFRDGFWHYVEGQFSTTVVRVWWTVRVRQGLGVLTTATVAEATKWIRVVVSHFDSVVSESTALNSLLR